MEDKINLKDLIKNNVVYFDSYRQGFFYYNIDIIIDASTPPILGDTYQFPIPIEDIGTATLNSKDKAITFMRWIRKAINDGTLVKIN